MVTIKGSGDHPDLIVTKIGCDIWSSETYGHYRDIVISSVLAIPLLILIAAAVLAAKVRWSE